MPSGGGGSQTSTQVSQPAPWISDQKQGMPYVANSAFALLNGRNPFAGALGGNSGGGTSPPGTGGVMNGYRPPNQGALGGNLGIVGSGRGQERMAAPGAGGNQTGGLSSMPKLGAQLFSPYPDSTVVPYSQQSLDSQSMIEGLARQPNPLANAANRSVTGILQDNGINSVAKNGLATLGAINSGRSGITTGKMYQDLWNANQQPSAIADNLGAYARGDYLQNGGNPYFQKQLQDQVDAARNDINMGFSMGGRYGSGAQAGVLGDKLGSMRNNALAQNYEAEAGRQMQAAQMLSGEQQQQWNNRYQATGGLTGVQSQNLANRMGAGQALIGAGQQANAQQLQAAALAPSMDALRYAGADRLAQVGAAKEDYTQRQMQDDMDRWYANRDQPLNALNWYSGLLAGTGAGSGTTTTTTPQAKSSGFAGALGGGLGGAKLGSAFGPWGTAIGGGLGALGGLFG